MWAPPVQFFTTQIQPPTFSKKNCPNEGSIRPPGVKVTRFVQSKPGVLMRGTPRPLPPAAHCAGRSHWCEGDKRAAMGACPGRSSAAGRVCSPAGRPGEHRTPLCPKTHHSFPSSISRTLRFLMLIATEISHKKNRTQRGAKCMRRKMNPVVPGVFCSQSMGCFEAWGGEDGLHPLAFLFG